MGWFLIQSKAGLVMLLWGQGFCFFDSVITDNTRKIVHRPISAMAANLIIDISKIFSPDLSGPCLANELLREST